MYSNMMILVSSTWFHGTHGRWMSSKLVASCDPWGLVLTWRRFRPTKSGHKNHQFFLRGFPIKRGSRKWMGQALLKTVDWWLGCIWGHNFELESPGWVHHGLQSCCFMLPLEGWEVVYTVMSQEFNILFFFVSRFDDLHNLLVSCAAFGFGGFFGINVEISRDHR